MDILVMAVSILFGGSTCNAGVFGYEGDPLAGGTNACTGVKMGRTEMGIAHRTLPCGTKVILFNPRSSKATTAVVVDHGPYGAMNEGVWVLKRKRSDPGKWRGCLDISRSVARALDFDGFGKIFYAPVAHW